MKYQVYYEATPNPQAMKFIVDQQIASTQKHYVSQEEAWDSPLATKIFGFPWAQSVFIGPHFVTVTKQDWVDWAILADPLAGLIEEHFEAGEPAIAENSEVPKPSAYESGSLEGQIERVLNQEIRPVVALDGGDIVFSRFEDNKVYVHMQGSCSGCPSSVQTLKMGIENRLRQLFPEVKEVVAL